MKRIYIILIIIFILSGYLIAQGAYAQEAKTLGPVSQVYPGLGVDMQYYEIKYDSTNKDYIGYYQVIREKIMQKLKNQYRDHYKNGDVHLSFTLKSDGKLESFFVDRAKSSDDNALIDIATTGLKRSSPFPPFPKELATPKISFSVIISFKEKA